MVKITSAKSPVVQRFKELKTAKGRRKEGLFLVEGEVMIREAISCGLKIAEAVGEEKFEVFLDELEKDGAKVYSAPRNLIESISETQTPQGVCAAFEMPEAAGIENLPDRIVALDGVQDPGNVGTIWRTADAAGFQGMLLGAGSADPLSPKVQRAAMGSGFRVSFAHAENLAEALLELRKRGYHVFASDLNGADFYERPDGGEKFVLVIGNEARGISDAVRSAADCLVKLPMRGGAESLNAAVAAGIMMYELMRGK